MSKIEKSWKSFSESRISDVMKRGVGKATAGVTSMFLPKQVDMAISYLESVVEDITELSAEDIREHLRGMLFFDPSKKHTIDSDQIMEEISKMIKKEISKRNK